MKQFVVHIAELPSNSSEATEDFFSFFITRIKLDMKVLISKLQFFFICTKNVKKNKNKIGQIWKC